MGSEYPHWASLGVSERERERASHLLLGPFLPHRIPPPRAAAARTLLWSSLDSCSLGACATQARRDALVAHLASLGFMGALRPSSVCVCVCVRACILVVACELQLGSL